jgi:hypothetical protein
MPRVVNDDGEVMAELSSFDQLTRILILANLSGYPDSSSVQRGDELRIPGSYLGLPGGKHVTSEEELFRSYELWINSPDAGFAPPPVLDDDGQRVPLTVYVRARSVDDFAGVAIRKRVADPEKGELNQLAELNDVCLRILNTLGDADPATAGEEHTRLRRAQAYADTADVLLGALDLDEQTTPATGVLEDLAGYLASKGAREEGIRVGLPGVAARFLIDTLSLETKRLVARLLRQIACAYRTSCSLEIQRVQFRELRGGWLAQLARTAENVSAENASLEQQVRNVVAILRNAAAGRAREDNSLDLEIYDAPASALMTDEDAWAGFCQWMIDRHDLAFRVDFGYSLIVLPIAIASPEMSGDDQALALRFLERLMDLGEMLQVMFFLDVTPAGLRQGLEGADRTDFGTVHEELTETLRELAGARAAADSLGQRLRESVGGHEKSQWVVLCGGPALFAQRALDSDLSIPGGGGPRAVPVSIAAEAAGLLAWSAGSTGLIGLTSAGNIGPGAMPLWSVTSPTDEHFSLAAEGGVNLCCVWGRETTPTFDGSYTLQNADPLFRERGAQTIEAVLMKQVLWRSLRRLLLQMPTSAYTPAGRFAEVVAPMNAVLHELVEKGRLISAFCADVTDPRSEMRGQVQFRVSYVLNTAGIDRQERTVTIQGGDRRGAVAASA